MFYTSLYKTWKCNKVYGENTLWTLIWHVGVAARDHLYLKYVDRYATHKGVKVCMRGAVSSIGRATHKGVKVCMRGAVSSIGSICDQCRPRPACASAQSDQGLHRSLAMVIQRFQVRVPDWAAHYSRPVAFGLQRGAVTDIYSRLSHRESQFPRN